MTMVERSSIVRISLGFIIACMWAMEIQRAIVHYSMLCVQMAKVYNILILSSPVSSLVIDSSEQIESPIITSSVAAYTGKSVHLSPSLLPLSESTP